MATNQLEFIVYAVEINQNTEPKSNTRYLAAVKDNKFETRHERFAEVAGSCEFENVDLLAAGLFVHYANALNDGLTQFNITQFNLGDKLDTAPSLRIGCNGPDSTFRLTRALNEDEMRRLSYLLQKGIGDYHKAKE